MPAIVCRGLRKRYGNVIALDRLDLTVPEGSIFGFLEPNGAGKSTAIRILATLSRPTAGDASIAGLSVTKHADRVRRVLGYLPQEPAFPSWMSAREFLEFAAALSDVPARERRARGAEALDLVGLTGAAGRRIGGFSGGMKGRLGIAQALIHRPAVMILDEPVSALDPLGRRDVLRIIAGLRDTTTVFLSSHILDDIDRVCDQVAILAEGRLIVQETIMGLKERYAQPTFVIEVAEDASPLAASLARYSWIASASADGRTVRVLARDPARAERELPRLALDAGHTLVRYEQVLPSLEDIFVRLVQPSTEGAA
ncbi:MAG: ATP-binding cassette domain-containing protein [Chloroflexota bacterium]